MQVRGGMLVLGVLTAISPGFAWAQASVPCTLPVEMPFMSAIAGRQGSSLLVWTGMKGRGGDLAKRVHVGRLTADRGGLRMDQEQVFEDPLFSGLPAVATDGNQFLVVWG